jgi:hypothetical protein
MDDVWVTDHKTALCLGMALRYGIAKRAIREKRKGGFETRPYEETKFRGWATCLPMLFWATDDRKDRVRVQYRNQRNLWNLWPETIAADRPADARIRAGTRWCVEENSFAPLGLKRRLELIVSGGSRPRLSFLATLRV